MPWLDWFRPTPRAPRRASRQRTPWRTQAPRTVEALESRQLLTITVHFATTLGDFDVDLLDKEAPETVGNFLNYVASGRYTNTLIHRSTTEATAGVTVIQGGGFALPSNSVSSIVSVQTDPGIPDEFTRSNLRGTIAMAKTNQPNSATSQWFVNVLDNADLDAQNFSVFGVVQAAGMSVIDALHLPGVNRATDFPAAVQGAFTQVPLRNYTSPNVVQVSNLLVVNSVSIVGQTDPIIPPIPNFSITSLQGFDQIDVQASDFNTPQATPLVWTLEPGSPASAMLTSDGKFTWHPTAADEGHTLHFTMKVTNSLGRSDLETFDIMVVAPRPSAVPGVPDLIAGNDTGNLDNDNLTNRNNRDANSRLSFTVSNTVPDALIEILADGVVIGSTTATSQITQVTTNGTTIIPDGARQITARQTELGQLPTTSATALAATIDATAPLLPEDLDPAFSDDGRQTTQLTADQVGLGGALQTDGKLLVVGTSAPGANRDVFLARYNTDGTRDSAFGGGNPVVTGIGTQDDVGNAVVVQGDGKIVVAGSTGADAVGNRTYLVLRFTATGDLDPEFASGSGVVIPVGNHVEAVGVALGTGGTILVGGTSDGDFSLARITAAGAIDTSLGGTGAVTASFGGTDVARRMLVLPDGRIVIVGQSGGQLAIARFLSNGQLDNSFDGDGKLLVAFDQAFTADDVVRSSNGRLIVLGHTSAGYALAAIDENGALDTTFGIGGRIAITQPDGTPAAAAGLEIQPNGQLVISGNWQFGAETDWIVMRLSDTGVRESSFGTLGRAIVDFDAVQTGNNTATDSLLTASGQIVVVGTTSSTSNGTNVAIARLAGGDPVTLALGAGSDTGASSTDGITNDATPTFVVGHRGEHYRVERNSTVVGDAFSLADSFDAPAQPEGGQSYFVRLLDAAGNVSAPRGNLVLTFDYTAPTAGLVQLLTSTGAQGTFDIPVGTGEQLRTAALGGADTIRVHFSEKVDAHLANASLTGSLTGPVAFSSLVGALATGAPIGSFTPAWRIDLKTSSPLAANELELRLLSSAAGIADLAGNLLDGEWQNPAGVSTQSSDSYPSGNGTAGGDFLFQFAVLPGDANRDLRVDTADQAIWAANNGTNGNFTQGDFNGDGAVNAADDAIRAANNGIDFTLQPPATITGTVWQDFDSDGQRDAEDVGVTPWTVFLDLNGNTTFDEGEPSAATNGQGAFSLVNLQPGTFNLRSVLPSGWTPAMGFNVVTSVTLEAAQTKNVDLGVRHATATPTAVDLTSDTGQSATDDVTNLDNRDAAHRLEFQVTGTVAGATVSLFAGPWLIGSAAASGATTTVQTNGSVDLADSIWTITARQQVPGDSLSDGSPALPISIDTQAPLPLAQGGALDPGFGSDGRATLQVGTMTDVINALAIQSDGKIVAVGETKTGDTTSSFVIARFLANGTPDANFGTGGVVTGSFGMANNAAYAVQIAVDGAIIVGGKSQEGGQHRGIIARYLTGGTLDTSFDQDGFVSMTFGVGSAGIRTLELLEGGKILVAGEVIDGAALNFGVARLLATGATDPDFDSDGLVVTDVTGENELPLDIVPQSDGKFIVLGPWVGATQGAAIARYLANGSLDASFSGDGKQSIALGNSGAGVNGVLDSQGNLIVAGYFGETVDTGSIALVRLRPDGTPDEQFASGGRRTYALPGAAQAAAQAISRLPDGKLQIVGQTLQGGAIGIVLGRFENDGTPDPSFGTNGLSTANFVGTGDETFAMAVTATGRVLVAGSAAATPVTTDSALGLLQVFDPIDAAPTLAPASDTGTLGDSLTADATPTLNLPRDGLFNLYDGNTRVGSPFNSGTPFTLTTPLPDGAHSLRIAAVDVAGNERFGGPLSLATDATAPTVTLSVFAANPQTGTPETLAIDFSEPIVGFELADLLLTRNGGANLLNGSHILSSVDQRHWLLVIGDLAAPTGNYSLSFAQGDRGITDPAGGALATPPSLQFAVSNVTFNDLTFGGFLRRENQSAAPDNTFDRWTAVHAGTMTLVAQYSSAGGTAVLQLFDANRVSLGAATEVSPGVLRIDRAVAEGEVFLSRLSGTNTQVTLILANQVQLAAGMSQVFGTTQADVLEFDAEAQRPLTINGIDYALVPPAGAETLNVVTFAGAGGDDMATLRGGAQSAEDAYLAPGHGELRSTSFRVALDQTPRIVVDGRAGGDSAVLIGDPNGTDRLSLSPNLAVFASTASSTGAVFQNTLQNFMRIDASGDPNNDSLDLHGSDADEQLHLSTQGRVLATPRWSTQPMRIVGPTATLAGPGVLYSAGSFLDFTLAGGGGNNTLSIQGSPQEDELLVTPTGAQWTSAGLVATASEFRQLRADGQGGYDTLRFNGVVANERLLIAPTLAHWSSDTRSVEARGFEDITAIAVGASPIAQLYGSDEADSAVTTPGRASLATPASLIRALGFAATNLHAAGGNDRLLMVSNDSAAVVDAGAEQVRLAAANQVVESYDFEDVAAYAAGGTSQATLRGTSGNDMLTLDGKLARLASADLVLAMYQFQGVAAQANGGTDLVDQKAIDFTLSLEGNWQTP